MSIWRLADIPSLKGKVAIITGGNTGLGFKSSLELARAGAQVVIGCRSIDKGEQSKSEILSEVPNAQIRIIALDLTEPESIEKFATTILNDFQHIDILLNNAGVVNLDTLQKTKRGHEMHMATNHYGHFALTGYLFRMLVATPGARVVTLSSLSHKQGTIVLDDLDWSKRKYDRAKAYGDSKLANLMFTEVLQSRFDAAGSDALAVSAHPGLTGTERQQSIGIGGMLARKIASPVKEGVLSQLRAACDPPIRPRDFVGPRFGLRGAPTILGKKLNTRERKKAILLWQITSEITGVTYPA